MLLTIAIIWWTFISLTGLIILLRIFFLVRDRKRPTVADGFMLLTWLSSIVMVAIMTNLDPNLKQMKLILMEQAKAMHATLGRVAEKRNEKAVYNTEMPLYRKASREVIRVTYKLQFFIAVMYPVVLWSAKATLWAIYFNVMPVMKRLSKCLLLFGIFYTACTFCIVFLYTLLWCGNDMRNNWTLNQRTHELCVSLAAKPILLTSTIATLTTDLLILATGVVIFRSMTIHGRRELWALLFVFAIGLVTISSILVRFSLIINIRRNNGRFSRWMAVECIASLVACCLPTARTVYRRLVSAMVGTAAASSEKSGGCASSGNGETVSKGGTAQATGSASASASGSRSEVEFETMWVQDQA